MITPELIPLVKRSGMLPFYTEIHTDHRGLFIDIDSKALFEGKNCRTLPSSNENTVVKNAEISAEVQTRIMEATPSVQHPATQQRDSNKKRE